MKKFLAIVLATTAMVWAQGPITDGLELVDGTVNWSAYKGGTNVVTVNGGESTTDTPIEVSMILDASSGWAEVSPGWTPDNFLNLTGGTITINNPNQVIRLALIGTDSESEGAFGAYCVPIPAGHTGAKTFTLNDFVASWGAGTGLDLSLATGIAIIPGVDGNAADPVEISFTLSSLVLNTGSGGEPEPCDNWGNWEITTAATCDAAGLETKKSNCTGVADSTRVIPQLTEGCGGEPTDGIYEIIGGEYTEWSSYIDNYDAGTEVTINEEDPLNAILTLAAEDEGNDIWPYLGLGVYLEEGAFANLTTVKISYEADGALKLGIGVKVEPFEQDGSLYTEEVTYEATLPSGSNSKTFTLSDFKKPSWPDSYSGPANLSLVEKDSISAGLTFFHESYGSSVELTVTSLTVDGQDDGTAIDNSNRKVGLKSVKSATLAVTGISAGKLGLNVPTTGNYSIALYSVDGKMLSQTKTNLKAGVNTLSVGQNLAKGVAIVRIKGLNTQLVKKIMVK